jgi:uncharacterized membrane protein
MMKIHHFGMCRLGTASIAASAIVFLLLFVSSASAWNFRIPAHEVRPENGVFQFPESLFADGKARHFVYKHSSNQWLRFFVLKSSDGKIRAAFDACDVCFRQKKGYVQAGSSMQCVNCGMKFRSTKINEVKGGCNPAPLRRKVERGVVYISQSDVLSGLRFFQ